MAELEQVLGKIDKQFDALNDFVKSSQAEKEAMQKGVETLQSEVAEQRKEMQEMAEAAKKVYTQSDRDQEVVREFGKSIVASARGKAASEGTDSAGGYVVEDQQLRMIKSVQNKYGVVRQMFGDQIVPMTSDVLKVPVDTFEVSGVSGTGNVPTPAATSENNAITASADAELDQILLTAQKYATLNYVSNELISDAFVGFLGAYLYPKIARQAAKIEDQVVFTAATTGLFNSTNMQRLVMESGSSAFTDLDYDSIINLEDEVADEALESGMYFGHRTIVNLLKKIKGTDGHPIWMPATGPEPATVNGYGIMKGSVIPARSGSAVSTGFLGFGDPTMACVVGERTTRSIVTSDHYRFNYDQVAVRMTFRFAMGSNSNTGHAFAVLVTAAE